MNENPRTLVAHAMIALGLIVGVQMMLVQPAQEEASESARQVEEMTRQINEINDPSSSAAMLERREERAVERLRAVSEGNGFVDPAELVSHVQRLGAETGVTVERIDPETLDPRSGVRPGDKRAPTLPTKAVALRIEARGTYRQVARFVAGVETRPGFVRTDELTLRPTMAPGRDEVGVSIRTAQLGFDPKTFEPAPVVEGVTP